MNKRFFFICLIILLFCFPNILVFNVSSDPPEDKPEPYFYYYPPANSFGVDVTKTINWSFFKNMFQSHFYKDCMYKRFSYSDWQSGNSYVTVDKTWNDSGFWKIDINLEVPVDIYEVNISFGCDLPVLNYVERDGYEIWLNYSIPDSEEVYSVFFNWSDIAGISGLTVDKHFDNGIWWISLHRNDVPAGFYSFDPIFGCQDEGGSGTNINNYIVSATFLNVGGNGIADNITVCVKDYSTLADYNIFCMIQDDSGNLINCTEERIITLTSSYQWFVFDLSNSSVAIENNTRYNLSVWGEGGGIAPTVARESTGGLGYGADSDIYNYCSPENPIDRSSVRDYDGLVSIYCSYTVSGWSNTCPSSNNEVPTNSSNGISVNTDFNVTIVDVDGNNTWGNFSCRENADTGSWANQANGSRVFDLTNPLDYNTEYRINVNYSDTEGCEVRDFFLFTTETANSNPVLSGEDPYNGSTAVSLTPECYVICTDSDGDVMNVTWWSNSSGSWKKFGLTNTSVSSGTNITQNYANASVNSQTYWWNISCSDGEGGWVNETYHFTTVSAVNNPPVLSGESPVNGSTDIGRKPDVYVVCTDADSDTMNATFSSNSSGTWKNFAGNTSISSGTNITQNFINASVYGTTYWFRVNISDGEGGFDNETFHFTVEANVAVVLSNENPANNSFNNAVNLTWNITCEDGNGDTFNWTIQVSNGNSSNANDDTNGSKTCTVAWLDWYTSYTVWVNVTDGNLTTNESFVFTTGNLTVVTITISGVYPANDSTNIPVQIFVYALFNHTNGSVMNISFYYGSQGSENILMGQETNVTNGTYNEIFLNASERATDYYFRIQADDGYQWINETFSFKTEGFAGGGKRPSTLWVFAFFGVAIGIMAFFEIKRRNKKYD